MYKYTKVDGVMKVQAEIIGEMMFLFVACYFFGDWDVGDCCAGLY